ncbi:hypothetical protein L9F63_024958, partial [Diploptera punctata]
MLNTGKFRRLYPTSSGTRYSGYLQELQSLMLQDSNNIFQPANSLFRETLRHSTSDLHGVQTRLEQIFNSQRETLDGAETFSDPDSEPEMEDEYAYPSETRIPPSLNLQSIQSKPSQSQRHNCSQGKTHSACSHVFLSSCREFINEICLRTRKNSRYKLNYCYIK